MQRAQAVMLPDGRRLHLQHGPIDLILEAEGPGRAEAYKRAARRFDTVLEELVSELSELRRNFIGIPSDFSPIARRMGAAVAPFADGEFVTPMAAVAGAVADEILAEVTTDPMIRKAYANNGGDVALHLGAGESFTAAVAASPAAKAHITPGMGVGGMATSGWAGRSHSLGIADSVTVLADTAASADVAATLIANAVDLPGHPGIVRVPAVELSPDSDLGERLVTRGVPVLTEDERRAALEAGCARVDSYLRRGLIRAAYLVLQGETRVLAAPEMLPAFKETADA